MPEILQYDFMIRAFIGGLLVGGLAPALGLFLVLRRLALISDSLSHVALTGVAIGLLTRTYPPIAGLGATAVAAVAIETVRLRRLMPGDAALAVVLYSALAVAVVIISLAEGFNVDLFAYLFGSILTVTATDLWLLAGLTVIVIGFVVVFYSELSQSSFDTDLARSNGVHVFRVNLALAILTGATITLSMRVVGVLLVGALIVVPVMVSLRFATGLKVALFGGVAVGVSSALVGLTIAFYANVAAGGAIVLTSVGVLVISMTAPYATNRSRRLRRRA
ncbi:MAG: metal ABC transporter permease [SAR202 cluster bacterium]|jgi:zinc transport system permease protein|nr:metal ABC transporter permease [SAR202 cluster bacterium]MDP6300706.1 metal ABC transporter permease [SAR202 cluster bacterium]MDP7103569.1 metal ABC transporter permease [SAR202 cluster bacterium]MDP7223955.1 metal ABC transporter permease [SAR202 cluster bacterium]MDP7413189.1 metal ABC transporter permease [SAR202 cluster bacterium]|tara:strand:- start:3603 stop:4433 length:831 start_codon:yes stop_codon:yes gene_type:complete